MVVVLPADLQDVSIDGQRDFRLYVSTITLLLPEKQIKTLYLSFGTLKTTLLIVTSLVVVVVSRSS
jgi:hypothetical protein